jgi:DNA-binding transcriptional ArsR family regulator
MVEEMEEETYSLIFTSLKHTIRRRILRMLAEKPLTYSEILEILGIDSGHLSYHIENLGELAYNDETGRYRLSSFGKAAVTLMGGIEEQAPVPSQRKFVPRQLGAKVYAIVLALLLVFASFYFVSYVSAVPAASETTRWTFSNNPALIDPEKTSELDFTLKAATETENQSIAVTVGFEGTTSQSQRESSFISWYEDSMWLEINQNLNYSIDGVLGGTPVSNETALDITELPSGIVAKFNDPTTAAIFYKTDFSQISVEVSTPNGTVITDCFDGADSYTVDYVSVLQSGWLIDSGNPPTFKSCKIPIDELGSYEVKITNIGSAPWSGKFSINLTSQQMERPYFFVGIAGLVAALAYLILVTTWSLMRSKSNEKQE